MIQRKPLTLLNGEIQELPVNDILTGTMSCAGQSTGLYSGGNITINANPTKIDITQISLVVMDYSNPLNPIPNIRMFGPFIGVPITNILTTKITHISIDEFGTIIQNDKPFTASERRHVVCIGSAVHPDMNVIQYIDVYSVTIRSVSNQLYDLFIGLGSLNIEGNVYSPNGSTLMMQRSNGVIFKAGSNFQNDPDNPHVSVIVGEVPVSFRYRLSNGSETALTTFIDPDSYESPIGTISNVINNKFTIQRITMFSNGSTRLQYGQHLFNSMSEAIEALDSEQFVTENVIADNGIFRSYLIIEKGTTSLKNTANAKFIIKGSMASLSSGGITLTYSNIIAALGYVPENENNKVVDFTTPDNNTYPSTLAVENRIMSNRVSVTTEVDFGFVGTNNIEVIVPVSWAGISEVVDISISPVLSDHDYEDVVIEGVTAIIGEIVTGVSLKVYSHAPSDTWGKYNITIIGIR